jgi:hypothetical protein
MYSTVAVTLNALSFIDQKADRKRPLIKTGLLRKCKIVKFTSINFIFEEKDERPPLIDFTSAPPVFWG